MTKAEKIRTEQVKTRVKEVRKLLIKAISKLPAEKRFDPYYESMLQIFADLWSEMKN